MSVYAPVPAFADGKRHPRALILIVAGHAALIATAMTARMDLPIPFVPGDTEVTFVPLPPEPPENPPPPDPNRHESRIDRPITMIPIAQPSQSQLDPVPLPIQPIQPAIDHGPPGNSVAPVAPVRVAARFVTPETQIRPPYPQSKLRSEEEAVLRLRLGIDARGRVTAVEAVGPADPVFLAAARRHLIAHWRYRPATEDGRPVATSTVITLRFELND